MFTRVPTDNDWLSQGHEAVSLPAACAAGALSAANGNAIASAAGAIILRMFGLIGPPVPKQQTYAGGYRSHSPRRYG
jgi:hypothetical protein